MFTSGKCLKPSEHQLLQTHLNKPRVKSMLPINTIVRKVNAGDKKNETRKAIFVLIFD